MRKPPATAFKELSPEESEELLKALMPRFMENMNHHESLEWAKVQTRLEANPEKMWSINEMEKTGGEPDVDRDAQEQREKKGVHPNGNVIDMAASMGIELLTEEQYRELQKLGEFDTKTSSWVKTPSDIRKLGGAIFADRRYNHVFIYHNSAPSFYSARGFRGVLRV